MLALRLYLAMGTSLRGPGACGLSVSPPVKIATAILWFRVRVFLSPSPIAIPSPLCVDAFLPRAQSLGPCSTTRRRLHRSGDERPDGLRGSRGPEGGSCAAPDKGAVAVSVLRQPSPGPSRCGGSSRQRTTRTRSTASVMTDAAHSAGTSVSRRQPSCSLSLEIASSAGRRAPMPICPRSTH